MKRMKTHEIYNKSKTDLIHVKKKMCMNLKHLNYFIDGKK